MKLDTLDYGAKASVTTQSLQSLGIDTINFTQTLEAYNTCNVTAVTNKGVDIPLGALCWADASEFVKDMIFRTPEGLKLLLDNISNGGEH